MSKKSKSSTEPAKWAKPYITGAASNLQNVYNQNAGGIQSATDAVTGLIPSMVDKYNAGDAGINAARGYNTDVLAGRYLGSNPYLDQMIEQSGNDVRNQTQAAMGVRGLTGGSDYAGLIADRVSQNSLATRYGDYDQERARMATAAGQSPSIAAGDAIQISPLLGALDASMMPVQAASGYAGGLGGLLGQYATTKQKQGLGAMLGGLAGAGLSGWASGGFM